jgi:hypothetical protein
MQKFESTFTSFFKTKSQKEVIRQYGGNQGFSYYYFCLIEGSGTVPLTNGSLIHIREAKKHTDPQQWHWVQQSYSSRWQRKIRLPLAENS